MMHPTRPSASMYNSQSRRSRHPSKPLHASPSRPRMPRPGADNAMRGDDSPPGGMAGVGGGHGHEHGRVRARHRRFRTRHDGGASAAAAHSHAHAHAAPPSSSASSGAIPVQVLRKPPRKRSPAEVKMVWKWLEHNPGLKDELLGPGTGFADAAHTLCSTVQLIHVPANTVLFRQGDDGDCAYLVLAGTCDIHFTPQRMQAYLRHGSSGKASPQDGGTDIDGLGVTLMHVTEGAVVGESAALVSGHLQSMPTFSKEELHQRPCSVATTSACDLLRLDLDVFRACMEATPKTMELHDLVIGLSEMLIFSHCSVVELTFLAKWTSQQEYRSDEVIFKQGAVVTNIHFLLRGEVTMVCKQQTSTRSQELEVEHFTPPSVFGDHAVVLDASRRRGTNRFGRSRSSRTTTTTTRHAFSATASSHCSVASLPVQLFRQLVLQYSAQGKGGLLDALDAGGFVPPVATLSQFATDRERHLRRLVSLGIGKRDDDHDTTLHTNSIRCYKCGQRGHAATRCGAADGSTMKHGKGAGAGAGAGVVFQVNGAGSFDHHQHRGGRSAHHHRHRQASPHQSHTRAKRRGSKSRKPSWRRDSTDSRTSSVRQRSSHHRAHSIASRSSVTQSAASQSTSHPSGGSSSFLSPSMLHRRKTRSTASGHSGSQAPGTSGSSTGPNTTRRGRDTPPSASPSSHRRHRAQHRERHRQPRRHSRQQHAARHKREHSKHDHSSNDRGRGRDRDRDRTQARRRRPVRGSVTSPVSSVASHSTTASARLRAGDSASPRAVLDRKKGRPDRRRIGDSPRRVARGLSSMSSYDRHSAGAGSDSDGASVHSGGGRPATLADLLLPGRSLDDSFHGSVTTGSSFGNHSDVARRKLLDQEHDALAAALNLLNGNAAPSQPKPSFPVAHVEDHIVPLFGGGADKDGGAGLDDIVFASQSTVSVGAPSGGNNDRSSASASAVSHAKSTASREPLPNPNPRLSHTRSRLTDSSDASASGGGEAHNAAASGGAAAELSGSLNFRGKAARAREKRTRRTARASDSQTSSPMHSASPHHSASPKSRRGSLDDRVDRRTAAGRIGKGKGKAGLMGAGTAGTARMLARREQEQQHGVSPKARSATSHDPKSYHTAAAPVTIIRARPQLHLRARRPAMASAARATPRSDGSVRSSPLPTPPPGRKRNATRPAFDAGVGSRASASPSSSSSQRTRRPARVVQIQDAAGSPARPSPRTRRMRVVAQSRNLGSISPIVPGR